MTKHRLQRDFNAWIVALIGNRLRLPDFFDVFVCRPAVGQHPSVSRVNKRVGPDIVQLQRQLLGFLEIGQGLLRRIPSRQAKFTIWPEAIIFR